MRKPAGFWPNGGDAVITIPADVMRAAVVVSLRSRARLVLAYVLAHTYGPEGQSVVSLSPTALGRLSGLNASHACSGVRDLVAAGILHPEPGTACGYRFNPHYAAWTERGVPVSDRWGGGLGAFLDCPLPALPMAVRPRLASFTMPRGD